MHMIPERTALIQRGPSSAPPLAKALRSTPGVENNARAEAIQAHRSSCMSVRLSRTAHCGSVGQLTSKMPPSAPGRLPRSLPAPAASTPPKRPASSSSSLADGRAGGAGVVIGADPGLIGEVDRGTRGRRALLHLVHGPQPQRFQRLVIQLAAVVIAHDRLSQITRSKSTYL